MQALSILEHKVAELLALVSQLKAENSKLSAQNAELKYKLETVEQTTSAKCDEYDQEVTSAQVMVDSLIKDIDAAVGCERV